MDNNDAMTMQQQRMQKLITPTPATVEQLVHPSTNQRKVDNMAAWRSTDIMPLTISKMAAQETKIIQTGLRRHYGRSGEFLGGGAADAEKLSTASSNAIPWMIRALHATSDPAELSAMSPEQVAQWVDALHWATTLTRNLAAIERHRPFTPPFLARSRDVSMIATIKGNAWSTLQWINYWDVVEQMRVIGLSEQIRPGGGEMIPDDDDDDSNDTKNILALLGSLNFAGERMLVDGSLREDIVLSVKPASDGDDLPTQAFVINGRQRAILRMRWGHTYRFHFDRSVSSSRGEFHPLYLTLSEVGGPGAPGSIMTAESLKVIRYAVYSAGNVVDHRTGGRGVFNIAPWRDVLPRYEPKGVGETHAVRVYYQCSEHPYMGSILLLYK